MSDTARLSRILDEASRKYQLADSGEALTTRVAQSRRAALRYSPPTVDLIERDGLLRWVHRPATAQSVGRRAARGSIVEQVVASVPIADLEPNQILEHVARLDDKLTPGRGLFRVLAYRAGGSAGDAPGELTLQPVDGPIRCERALLWVHGTFSKSQMFFDEFATSSEGRNYLAALLGDGSRYDAVFIFDHPTLAVTPLINAVDLTDAMAFVTATRLDVVCHSRGGLVVAWWLKLGGRADNVVFVGAPLAGTSLAAPPRLRDALDYFANLMQVISTSGAFAAQLVPAVGVVTGLAAVLGKALQLGAQTPAIDAAVLLVPGLASQSRVGNNAELLRLYTKAWPYPTRSHLVTAEFRPPEVDAGWRFWRRFNNVLGQAAYFVVEPIFAESNDLVVDCVSMGGPESASRAMPFLAPFASELRFAAGDGVHHCNYFRQARTLQVLERIRDA